MEQNHEKLKPKWFDFEINGDEVLTCEWNEKYWKHKQS